MTLATPQPFTWPADRAAPPSPAARRRRLRYEPALDGLRGVAVLAVVLYHAGWWAGGYLGVDTFFVLSGYLITSLLVAEHRDEGGIDLLAFWANRVRRLLPALLVMLVGVAALCFALPTSTLLQVRGDGLATLAYVMNWRLIAQSQSYFDQFFTSPLRHAWSLAIEEQYYLVWPLVVLLVLRHRGSLRALLGLCAGLAAASAAWMAMQYDGAVDPSRLYLGTDTRAQSLLVGSALAAAVALGLRVTDVDHRGRLLRATTGLGLVLGAAMVFLPGTNALLYRGGFLVFAAGVAALIFVCTQIGDNPVRRALAGEPLRLLGLISYGVYLYHYPLFLWLNSERTGLASGSVGLLVLRLVVTVAVATASYLLIERPIRQGALGRFRPRARQWAGPAAVAAAILLMAASTARATTPLTDRGDGDPLHRSTTAPGATDERRVLLVGDSVAYTMGVGFEGAVSSDNRLSVWNQAILFCELIAAPRREGDQVIPHSRTCDRWEQDWRHSAAEFHPDVAVVQLGAWEIFDRQIDGRWLAFGSPEYDQVLVPILQRAIDAVASDGATVVVLTTPPFRRDDGTSAREWTQNDTARTDHFNLLVRQLAAGDPTRVRVIDLGGWLCPGNVCRSEIDGARLRPDGVHYDVADAQAVDRWLAPQLRALADEHARSAATTTTATSG